MDKKLPESTLQYLLLALVPYSRPNLKLVFKPSLFFQDLDKIEKIKMANAKNAYYRAIRIGLIEIDESGIPRLTSKGRLKVQPFIAEKLSKNANLMIIFDIPEEESWKRRYLRLLLKELRFRQVQKSVWLSEYDHRELLVAEVEQNCLQDYVKMYEAACLD